MADNIIDAFINKERLREACEIIASKVTTALANKVDVDGDKVLSDNNLTDELVTKINLAENVKHSHANQAILDTITEEKVNQWDSSQENVIEKISVNGVEQDITEKAVDITVPTKVSDLTNDNNYQSDTEVSEAIANALDDITGIKFEVVTELPETGVNGTIYLIAADGEDQNIYNEYAWVGDKFEQLGTTEAKFSQYWSKAELTVATSEDVADIVNTAFADL